MTERCPARKQGEFHRLGCVKEHGHDGACNFVVLGVRESAPNRSLKSGPLLVDKDGNTLGDNNEKAKRKDGTSIAEAIWRRVDRSADCGDA